MTLSVMEICQIQVLGIGRDDEDVVGDGSKIR